MGLSSSFGWSYARDGVILHPIAKVSRCSAIIVKYRQESRPPLCLWFTLLTYQDKAGKARVKLTDQINSEAASVFKPYSTINLRYLFTKSGWTVQTVKTTLTHVNAQAVENLCNLSGKKMIQELMFSNAKKKKKTTTTTTDELSSRSRNENPNILQLGEKM